MRYILLFPDLDLDRTNLVCNPQADAAWTRPNAMSGVIYLIKKLPEAARTRKGGGERRTAGRDVTG